MVMLIKISSTKPEQPWLYMKIMLLMYTINLILDRIRMIIRFTLIHFNYITLYYQNIAIKYIKITKETSINIG